MRLSRIVRYDGVPTPAARAAAILLLVAAFASAFTAYSRGETPRRAPAADLITESGATGPAVGRRAPAPPRLAPAAGIPAMRGDRSPRHRRARRAARPAQVPKATPTPAPKATPAATPEALTPVSTPAAPRARPAPAPARPSPPPTGSFDLSG